MNKDLRKVVIAGNWKMNKTRPEAKALIEELKPIAAKATCDVVICVPFTNLETAIEATKGRVPLFVGAMDNSVARVRERIDMIGEGRAIDGIVVTVPFYAVPRDIDAICFFTEWYCRISFIYRNVSCFFFMQRE